MHIPDPYGRSIFHGKPLDNATIAALKIAEAELGYELTIAQGIGGAAASAGSHTEGRAVDLTAYDAEKKLHVLKDIGFAVWERKELPGVWGPHIHGCLIFERDDNDKGIAPVAFRQIAAYRAGRDGLAGNAPDPSYRPDPKAVFTRAEYERSFELPKPEPTNVSRARARISEALHATWQAAALLKDAEGRTKAQAQIDELQAARQALKAVLEALPER